MAKSRTFKSKEKLDELISLLSAPSYKYSDIARHFNCNHSSVISKAKKLGLAKPPIIRTRGPGQDPNGHCERCDMLFSYGGEGDGHRCDECLNELGIL